ncbi:hypothetical protein [Desulfofustis glycolicus]|uniref:Uncharacterized protein n=1 Tax=Desulfofustis glycolicus DSM 9705 TaxID=1121409 RepID=A0A1M5YDG7_9BACT|nr:hypothetical protein [Desulfofustis glycolicus]SHI09888.1 hypothetical protein SAMN02745124_03887 [Desulfofustis glycolicus DSM 9705]
MTRTTICINLLLAGTTLGALCGSLIPNHHYPAFYQQSVLFPSVFGGVWEYEFWGHVFGIFITLFLRVRFGSQIVLRFGLGYCVAFSTLIYSRSPGLHAIVPTLFGPILVILTLLAIIEIIVTLTKKFFIKNSLSKKRWLAWSVPTKLSIYMGAIGVFGVLLAVLSLFGFQAYDIIPGLDRPRPELLRYVHYGNEILLYGNDGTTLEQSIQIIGARSGKAGVFSEYFWLNTYYPRYQPIEQILIEKTHPQYPKVITRRNDDGTLKTIHTDNKSAIPRYFDQITIENWLGRSVRINFDITEFMHGNDEKNNIQKYRRGYQEKAISGAKGLEYTDWRFPFNR